jgi:predicted membrane protein
MQVSLNFLKKIKSKKVMKKLVVLVGIVVAALSSAVAQEFKIAKSTGRLEIFLGRVTVEGYNGNEIIFTSLDSRNDKDTRAEGLRAISALGLEDNTGLGINVTDKGTSVEVRQLKKMNSPRIKIQVPKGVTVYYEHESQYGGEVKLKDLENEIEVNANYNSVELENVSGPMTVKSVYGHVEAVLGGNLKSPISIVSVYGYVDVTLPVTTKADLKMSTSYGELYAASEFKIEYEKQGNLVRYDDKVTGKINGGGIKIDLSSNYGKVYLRKK